MLQPNKEGFTFIELMVVILIIGIFVGVTTPLLSQYRDNRQTENLAIEVFYLFRFLQANAINQGKVYFVSVDGPEGVIRAYFKESTSGDDGETINKELKGRFASKEVPEATSITVESKEGEAAKKDIHFYPDGSIDNITIRFSNKHGKELSIISEGAVGNIKIR